MGERIGNDNGAKWRIGEIGHGETGFPYLPFPYFSICTFVSKSDVSLARGKGIG
jgi:hypothetical protein